MMASAGDGFSAPEVARLVYGYLHGTNCNEAKDSFLEECAAGPDLKKIVDLVEQPQGILRGFDIAKIDGLTLQDILNEYAM